VETSLDSMSPDLSCTPSFRAQAENPVRPPTNQTSANKQNKLSPGPDTFPGLNSTLTVSSHSLFQFLSASGQLSHRYFSSLEGEADPVPESSCHNRIPFAAQK
ncbi:hypothetical protein GOODEAATRI_024230, partial [Goodea atripinnis]